MSIKDNNRAALVRTLIKQNGGRIFTVIARRKNPVYSYVLKHENVLAADNTPMKEADYKRAVKKGEINPDDFMLLTDNFMEMTCRTGVTKGLKGGKSTINHCPDLISVNLTNGKGFRCFSTFNVLEIRAGGAVIKFKEADVLSYKEDV